MNCENNACSILKVYSQPLLLSFKMMSFSVSNLNIFDCKGLRHASKQINKKRDADC